MKLLAESSKKAMAPIVEQVLPAPQSNKCNQKSLVYILFFSLTFGILCQMNGMYLQSLTASSILTIEVQSENKYTKLPAITFCANIGDLTHGKTSNEVLNEIKVQDMVDSIVVTSDNDQPERNYTYLMDSPIEKISYKYYCFTINSALKGNLLKTILN